MKTLIFLLLTLLVSLAQLTPSCQKYILTLEKAFADKDISKLPTNTLLYSGLSINNLGEYEECVKIPDYAYYLIYINNNDTKLDTFTGLCIQNVCTADDIQSYVQKLYSSKTFSYTSSDVDGLGWTGLVLFIIYLVVVISVATVNSVRSDQEQAKKALTKEQSEKKEYINTSINTKEDINRSINTKEDINKSVTTRQDLLSGPAQNSSQGLIVTFDAYRNYCKIFENTQDRSLLSGLKVITLFTIIASTQFSFRQTVAQNNYTAEHILNHGIGNLLVNINFAYTTLFWISGIATAYALYKIDSFAEMFRTYFCKILRIWPLLILFSLFAYGLSSAFISDPLYKIWQATNTLDCTKTIWRKFFFVNTLILDDSICLPWTWVVEDEMLLFLLAPLFVIVFKTKKSVGYFLLFLISAISIVFNYGMLDSRDITFVPSLILNNNHQYIYHYQMHPLVRAANFYFGLGLGIFFINGLQKLEAEQRTSQYKIAKAIKKSRVAQYVMQVLGLSLLSVAYWLIVPIQNGTSSIQYMKGFLTITPTLFLIGLSLLVIPSMFKGDAPTTRLLNTVLGGTFWNSFNHMSTSIYLMTPLVIGFTTYNLQASIYYSIESVFLLLIGDVVFILLTSLILTSILELPLVEIQKAIDMRIFGNSNKESVVVIED